MSLLNPGAASVSCLVRPQLALEPRGGADRPGDEQLQLFHLSRLRVEREIPLHRDVVGRVGDVPTHAHLDEPAVPLGAIEVIQ